MSLISRLRNWLWPRPCAESRPAEIGPGAIRGRVDHVVILDGTMASLRPGEESNAGLAFRLLAGSGPRRGRTPYYEEGLQWQGWRRGIDLVEGTGIEQQILRAYGHLASHYRAGDRIFLLGYSRGAFAVRSLAGVIDRIGLLRHDVATERNVQMAFRHYRMAADSPVARDFIRLYCHEDTPIEMVGVWETVKALGLRLPLLWIFAERRHGFHNAQLGRSVLHGFQALALDETRLAFAPVLWRTAGDLASRARVEQVWFRGAHAEIGGQIGTGPRGLSNIPLVWMLGRAEACGLTLPKDWRDGFPCDPAAPMVGDWAGFGKAFLFRCRRRPGLDPSERLHESVPLAQRRRWPLTADEPGQAEEAAEEDGLMDQVNRQ